MRVVNRTFPHRPPATTGPRARRPAPAALAALLAVAAASLPASGEDPGATARHIDDLQRTGQVQPALVLCRQLNADHPGDALMLYNQACLENRAGQTDAALVSLRAALEAGFADLDFAQRDPDLQGPAAASFAQVLAQHRQQRGAMSERRGARLAQGVPVTLALDHAPADAAPDGSRLTVTWQPLGLVLRLEADDAGGRWLPPTGAAPWSGDGGLLVACGPLAADGAGETADCFVFGFGLEKDVGVGAVYVAGTGRWQRVRELQPKIRGAGTEHLIVDVTIPWSAIAPYHPLVDPRLGLNVALAGRDGRAGPRLMPAAIGDRLDEPRQPAVRLLCDGATAAPGVMQGRVPTSIVTGTAVAVNLAVVAAGPGTGNLTLDFQDGEGRSLLAAGPSRQDVALETGVTLINRAVDFSQAAGGPCRVSATLDFPGGGSATWALWLLYLPTGWQDDYRAAVAAMPVDDRATAQYFLDAVTTAVTAHRGRRDPGPLTTTLGDLNLLLARWKQNGSLIGADGLTPFVYTGPDGAGRLCRLVLPAGRPAGAPLVPVVLAGHTADDAPRLADRLARLAAEAGPGAAVGDGGSWPVFVVAPAAPDGTADAELRACVQWAGTRFGAARPRLAVQRAAVTPALALARDPQTGLGGLLLVADAGLDPWPGLTADQLAQRVGRGPADLPVDWLEFTQETALGGGGRVLDQALATAGWQLRRQPVRGGANFTQVADRVWQWQMRAATTTDDRRPGDGR